MSETGSLHVYYSARIEQLVQALNRDISSYRQKKPNPLKPLDVIVPNGHIQKFLMQRLTTLNGIVANLNCPFLETGLFKALAATQSDSDQSSLLALEDIEIMVWGFLSQPDIKQNPALQPLTEYLSSHQNAALAAQKRWQLARQLSLLFIDYELTRPEMIQAWLNDQLFFSASSSPRLKDLETAQREVYISVFDQSEQAVTLTGLLRCKADRQTEHPQPLFIFVPSRLSPLHRHIILKLAQFYPVHIYHFNVCREYWLDLETEPEKAWRQSIQSLDLTVTDAQGVAIEGTSMNDAGQLQGECFVDLDAGLASQENPLLTAWGKPGRETLRLLSELENDAVHSGIAYQDTLLDEDHEEAVTIDNTLTAMQYSVLNRIPGERLHAELADTIQLASAPSIEVEVTQVYNSILYELQQDPTLQLTDIAVLVTDMSRYRYVIEQVFDRLNRHVNSPLYYSISDSHAGEESLYAQAVSQLLGIIETDFIRDEVFAFLANPCVITALDSHSGEVDAWLQAAVDLGIYRGFENLYDADDEATRQRYTWQQGLQRLHRSLAQSNAENSALNSHEIGRLSVLMQYLNSERLKLRQTTQSSSQWLQSMQDLLNTFIAVPTDLSREADVALAVSHDLQQLAERQPTLKLSYADIKQFMLARLADIRAGRGRYLSGGVVCAALQPMRPVPFKLSYILGLGETRFPGQIRHNTLDLAAYSRRIGDINQVENNKYLFLETVMSTRCKLFLSYVGRDEQSGELLSPSVVVNDVMEWLQQTVKPNFNALSLPLSSTDNFSHPARQRHASLLQNYSLHDYLLYCRQVSADKQLTGLDIASMNPAQKAIVKHFQTLDDNGQRHVPPVAHNDLTAEIPVPQLSDYLIKPTETVFTRQGGVLNRIEDSDLLSDEPITLNPLDKHLIMNRAVMADLNAEVSADGDSTLADFLQIEYNLFLQQSRVPIQLFAAIEPLKEIADNEDYQNLKATITSQQLIPWAGELVLGATNSRQAVARQLSAINITTADSQQVQLTTAIANLYDNRAGAVSAQVVVRAGKHNKTKAYELLSRSFLEWCVMVLHGSVSLAEEFQVWLIFQDKVITKTFSQYLVDNRLISEYLVSLCDDLLKGDKAYLPLSLYQKLSLPYKKSDTDQPQKTVPFNSSFYFAYDHLSESDLALLVNNYQQALETAGDSKQFKPDKSTPRYNEITATLSYPPSEQVLKDFRTRFMLFFALLEQVDIRELL